MHLRLWPWWSWVFEYKTHREWVTYITPKSNSDPNSYLLWINFHFKFKMILKQRRTLRKIWEALHYDLLKSFSIKHVKTFNMNWRLLSRAWKIPSRSTGIYIFANLEHFLIVLKVVKCVCYRIAYFYEDFLNRISYHKKLYPFLKLKVKSI